MRTSILALFSLLTVVCSAQSGDGVEPPSATATPATLVKEMTPPELLKMLGTPDLFVYDCNEDYMHAEAHVPGAVLVVYDEISADKLPADHSATLVFYCYSPECPAALSAARSAVNFGFKKVFCMHAGIIGWQDAGFATEP